MTLEEIARAAPYARPLAVPAWTLGCFHRRSITYATGAEDTTTSVVWIQSHGLTGDIRIPARRPDMSSRNRLSDCTPTELAALADVEGGVADTSFESGCMVWSNWTAFQPYDKWPEPGELRRVGPCLTEFAPSGIYVEDWRAQPGSAGLLVGLRLEAEVGADRAVRPRDGGLVLSGGHAILALGRRQPLPDDRPVRSQILDADDPAKVAAAAFDAEISYLKRRPDGGGWDVALSTTPFSRGAQVDLANGFTAGPSPDRLRQTLPPGADAVERLWRIDTLLPDVPIAMETPAHPSGAEWLRGEAETLLV